jgi:plasmid stabilization system protein ParE
MSRYTVVITERAAREIESTVDWWARERSAEQAHRWYLGIRDAVAGLADAADSRELAAEQGCVPYEIRELHFGLGPKPTHRVIFTVLWQSVLVLTVRHVAQKPVGPDDLP